MTVMLNTVILTKVKVNSIKDAALPPRYSNKLRSDAIRLDAVYVCGEPHDEIPEKIFLGEELNYDKIMLEGEAEIIDGESDRAGDLFSL